MAPANSNSKTPNPHNPSSLPPRFEIRQLHPEHALWAAAIVAHSNGFHSTVWPYIYPTAIGARVHTITAAAEYLVQHQIASGMSFGVFDTEYEYKSDEAREVDGKLFWNAGEEGVEEKEGWRAEGHRMLEQMDFPLVSVALSYDAAVPLDMEKMGSLMGCLPHFGLVYHVLGERDQRDPAEWQAKGRREVLMRNATSTRHDYEGMGIMAGLARWLQREARGEGYRGIQIECLADAVTHLWSDGADRQFKGRVISEFECETWEDEEGKKPFAPAKQRVTKCYVDLTTAP